MKAEDAKKLWCPFARAALVAGMAANRTSSMGRGGYADIADETRCLAEGCMAWRPFAGPQYRADEGCCGLANGSLIVRG